MDDKLNKPTPLSLLSAYKYGPDLEQAAQIYTTPLQE